MKAKIGVTFPTAAAVQTIVPGSYVKNPATSGSWTITPSTTANPLDDSAVGPEIFAQIAAGHVPPPAKDADPAASAWQDSSCGGIGDVCGNTLGTCTGPGASRGAGPR
ncbi:MAG TPA: hypothetical protein VE987_22135 [Polyangiaceae bacterium]|nr:hypothetical protein [Polyangiaceae bacterium]